MYIASESQKRSSNYTRFFGADVAFFRQTGRKPSNSGENGGISAKKQFANQINFHLYHYAGNNPVRYLDPDGKFQTDYQKQLTLDLSKLSRNDNGEVKQNVKIEIQRSWNDNGENGLYYQSKLFITYKGSKLNEVSVQSTPDWKKQMDKGNGERIPAGSYEGVLQKRSGKYKFAINIRSTFMKSLDIFIHPNVRTALGETEPYGQGNQKGKPFSLGCQITNLEDFKEITNILTSLGFDYGEGDWGFGDSIKIEIRAAQNWAMMENQ